MMIHIYFLVAAVAENELKFDVDLTIGGTVDGSVAGTSDITSEELRSFILETFDDVKEHGHVAYNNEDLFPPGFEQFSLQVRSKKTNLKKSLVN